MRNTTRAALIVLATALATALVASAVSAATSAGGTSVVGVKVVRGTPSNIVSTTFETFEAVPETSTSITVPPG